MQADAPSTHPPADRALSAVAFALAATALGRCIQINDGLFDPAAMVWLTIALAAALGGVVLARSRSPQRLGPRALVVVLVGGIAFQFVQLYTQWPLSQFRLRNPHPPLLAFHIGLAVAAALVLVGISQWRPARRAWFPLLLGVHLGMGSWALQASYEPFIDVFSAQRAALDALLSGENPYAATFPNPYREDDYPPKWVRDGRVQFGYPYMPLTLLMTVPARLAHADFRYAQLVAITLSAILIAATRPSLVASLAATLFLFTPRAFYVMEQSWTDPFLLLIVCATVFVAARAPRLLPVMFGLLLVAKQYMVMGAAALWLLLPRPITWRLLLRHAVVAAVVGSAITLPPVLWDVRAFLNSAVAIQLACPLRRDAVSYLAWLANATGILAPTWIGFAAVVPASALALWRLPRTPAGFAAAMAFIFLCFFAFNKYAFCNYYFFIIGLLCCAVAAARIDEPSHVHDRQ